MKKRRSLLAVLATAMLMLAGCDSPLKVLDPKGPVAKTQSDTIIFSMLMMAGVLVVVYVLYAFVLIKYRARKSNEDYEPPHEEGNKWLEVVWTVIPVIIVTILSVVTVQTTNAVEKTPPGYENQKPLVIYAASSNWKWHFSYPEEGIETVNYLRVPIDRPLEFRLYSFGPITSLWIPQLGGQKYAMSAHITTLHLAATEVGSYMGRNSNFSGEGYAHMEFETLAVTPGDFTKWVEEVKTTAPELTEAEFEKLLKTAHMGVKSYSNTHLEFSPAPGKHGDHDMDEEHQDHTELHPSPAPSERTEFDAEPDVSPTATPPSLSPSPAGETHSSH